MSENQDKATNTGFEFKFESIFCMGLLILVALAGSLAMSPSVADPDLWGHVQFGRDSLQTGLSETTSYSFTAEGFRWINHENLSEITMATVVDWFGPAGLLWGKFLLSLFVIGSILWFNFRQKVDLIPNAMIALLVAWNLGYHWSFRPQLSSFILFTLLVLLLQYCFASWRDQWHLRINSVRLFATDKPSTIEQSWFQGRLLWLAVPIILIWTNSHGGFVAGVCITIAYLMLRAFEALCIKGKDGWGLARRMALISAAVACTTLLNPYSFRLPMWLAESLGSPRPEIVDWSNGQLWTMVGMKFWILLAVAVFAMAFSKQKRDLVHCVILGITCWQALSHFRHVPFFTILCGFWMAPHLQSALTRFQQPESNSEPAWFGKPMARFAAVAGLVLLIAGISYRISDRLDRIQVDRSIYPVDAFAFMEQNDIDGRIVVTYNWAQYTIAALCAGDETETTSRVAFDGRFRTCYPQQVVDMHFDFLYGDQDILPRHRSPNSPPIDPARVLAHREPDLVINKRFDEVTSRHMIEQQEHWGLLYQDGLAQVWGRKSRFDDPQSVDFLPKDKRQISDVMPNGIVSWPAMPAKANSVNREKRLTKKMNSPNTNQKS